MSFFVDIHALQTLPRRTLTVTIPEARNPLFLAV